MIITEIQKRKDAESNSKLGKAVSQFNMLMGELNKMQLSESTIQKINMEIEISIPQNLQRIGGKNP